MKVVKFGGSSMADAGQYRKIRDILLADPERKVVVVSAAGKRFKDDHNITDLTPENAGELVSRIGITVRAKAECEQKFTDLLKAQGASLNRAGIVEKAYVPRNPNSPAQGGENGGGEGGGNEYTGGGLGD